MYTVYTSKGCAFKKLSVFERKCVLLTSISFFQRSTSLSWLNLKLTATVCVVFNPQQTPKEFSVLRAFREMTHCNSMHCIVQFRTKNISMLNINRAWECDVMKQPSVEDAPVDCVC